MIPEYLTSGVFLRFNEAKLNGKRIFLFWVLFGAGILLSTQANAQCAGGFCAVCNSSATITSISGATINNSTASINSAVGPGLSGTAVTPIEITATQCGEIAMTLELDFWWDDGPDQAFIHGISFDPSPGWTAASDLPPSPDWIFQNSITGLCSGETYGPGYYFDPVGVNIGNSGNWSSYDGTMCNNDVAAESFESIHPFLVDGDPSDNWGFSCFLGICPEFSFSLTYCPTSTGTITESVTFFITEDGETGGWSQSQGCIFELTYPITIHSAGIQLPETYGPICEGDCVMLDAGSGCSGYDWGSEGMGQMVEVCPTSTTSYTVSVTDNTCMLDATTMVIVEPCCVTEAGSLVSDSPQCPGSDITVSVSGYQMDPAYTQLILIANSMGNIVQIITGSSGTYTASECGTYTAYSYNYETAGTATVPTVGMNISSLACATIDAMTPCCDLESISISFEDTENPFFVSPPADITIECASILDPIQNLTWMDNCAGTGMVAGSESGTSTDCAGGTITRTWEYMDDCMNPVSYTQTITIDPLIEPVFDTPPADVTIACNAVPAMHPNLNYTNNAMNTACEISGSIPAATLPAYDECGGTIVNTWEYEDVCGRTIVEAQFITVEPAPQAVFLNLPADITINCLSSLPSFEDLNYSNSESGLCEIMGSVSPTINDQSMDCSGFVEATWTFMDDCGRTTNHVQTVTIQPAPEPSFTSLPGDMSAPCDALPPTATDLTYDNGDATCPITGTVSPVIVEDYDVCGGTITNTWEFTDPCGRMIMHSQVITVQAASAASFDMLPADITINCLTSLPTFDDLTYDNGGSGVCQIQGTASAIIDDQSMDCSGMVTATWSYTDLCGRPIMHTQTVTIEPAPEASFMSPPADISVDCDAVPSTAPQLTYSNGDMLCPISGTVDPTTVEDYDVCGGTITNTWEFTDVCNRTISHIQVITVNPVPEASFDMLPADITINCLTSLPSFDDLTYDNGGSGVCQIQGTATAVIDDQSMDCSGMVTATWSYTDLCGRPIMHTQTVTIEPATEASFMSPPVDISVDCDAVPSAAPQLTYDNGDMLCPISGTVDPVTVEDYDVCGGTITNTWEFTDVCNRTISHIQVITVNPVPEASFDMLPADITINCLTSLPTFDDLTYDNGGSGVCQIQGTASAIIDDQSMDCSGTVTATWSYTDLCGRPIMHTQTVTIEPATEASFMSPPADISVDCDAVPSAATQLTYDNGDMLCPISGTVDPTIVEDYDVCGGTITNTWEFTDVCNRTISHIQVITVNPVPEASFDMLPADITINCLTSLPSFDDLTYDNGGSGVCQIQGTVAAVIDDQSMDCSGMVTATWSYTDLCGRPIMHTQTVTIEPATEASFMSPPADISVDCDAVPSAAPQLTYDNGDMLCPISGTVNPIIVEDYDVCGGTITNTWEFTDVCNRTISHIQVITVNPVPEASFDMLPADITINCLTSLPSFDDLTYDNGGSGVCQIQGTASAIIDDQSMDCSGTVTATWSYTDLCGRPIMHTQTVTIEPATEASFMSPPADISVDCDAVPSAAPQLTYDNGDMLCPISGTVDPVTVEDYDVCGGTITNTWEFTDVCNRTISHIQVITVNPVPEATYINPPQDITIDCINDLPQFDDLDYSNALAGICEIMGSTPAVVDNNTSGCTGTVTATWTFTDGCNRTIQHIQNVTLEPIVEPSFINPPADITTSCGDAITDAPDLVYSNGDPDCLIDGAVIAMTTEDFDGCGGTIVHLWEFTDDCDRTFSHEQTITVDPAPQASFVNPPGDIVLECDEFAAFTPVPLSYTNGELGDCQIAGAVDGTIQSSINLCGGTAFVDYVFEDDCGRIISYTQTITINPAPVAAFQNVPADITVGCADFVDNPIGLDYDNSESGSCAISGTITDPITAGTFDGCGGVITYTWTYTDDCNRTITESQNVTVEPASDPVFINPPDDVTLACDEELPMDLSLDYDNNESGACNISGSEDPFITQNGNLYILTWVFFNDCTGNEIFHEQVYEQGVGVEFNEEVLSFNICAGENFDLSTITLNDINGSSFDLSYHTGTPTDDTNELGSSIVSPVTNTTYYIQGNNIYDCPDEVLVQINVETPTNAGDDNNDLVCQDEGSIDLSDYVSAGADAGDYIQTDGPSNLSLSDPTNVNIVGADPGVYTFNYVTPATANCPEDIAVFTIEILPEVAVDILNVICAPDFQSYSVEISNNAYTITVNAGTVTSIDDDGATISNIPIDQSLEITATESMNGCEAMFFVSPPNCACPDVPAPVSGGNETICFGEAVPQLSVTTGVDLSANWYDAPVGGTLLLGNSLNYTPAISGPGVYTYYVESVDVNNADCVSATRTEVVLEVFEVPDYTNTAVTRCDDDMDGIISWTVEDISSELSLLISESIEFYEDPADATNGVNPIAFPYDNTSAFTQLIYAAITNDVMCTTIIAINLTINPAPSLDLTVNNESCLGDEDGSIVINDFNASFNYSLNSNPVVNANIDNLPAGMYDIEVIDDNQCAHTESVVIEPGLELSIESFVWECNDNGTNTDPADDFYGITFIINNNQGATDQYNVLDESGMLLYLGTYGIEEYIELPADGSTPTLSFEDVDDLCGISQELGPLVPCSSTCEINVDQVDFECNDNGTPADPDDDFYTVTLLATAINGGMNYNVAINSIPTFTFDYGMTVNFDIPADGSNVTLNLTDAQDAACLVNVPLGNLDNCSGDCIMNIDLDNINCSDNGTDDNNDDDVFTFTISVSGMNLGTTFTIPELSFSGNYNELHNFGPFDISDGVINLTIIDDDNPSCTQTIMVMPPMACSDCIQTIEIIEPDPLSCTEDETTIVLNTSEAATFDWDGPDPFVSDEQDITVSEPGLYQVTVTFGNNCIQTAEVTVTDLSVEPNYSDAVSMQCDTDIDGITSWDSLYLQTSVNLVAGDQITYHLSLSEAEMNANPLMFPFDNTIPFNQVVFASITNPQGCSQVIEVELIVNPLPTLEVVVTHERCFGQENGTITISNFDANANYTINDDPVNMDFVENLPAGFYEIEVTDEFDCSYSEVYEVQAGLEIVLDEFNWECNNNATETDGSDDYYTITFLVSNNQANMGMFEFNDQNGLSDDFAYGESHQVIIPADGSSPTFLFTDQATDCFIEQEIGELTPCSTTCELSVDQLDFVCQDAGTPADSSDDFYDFTLLVSAVNGGTDYNVVITGGPNAGGPYLFPYGVPMNFSLPASGAIYTISLSDAQDPACLDNKNVGPLFSCSDGCFLDPVIVISDCNDNGTNDDATDDTFSFDINVTGTNIGTSYTIEPLGNQVSYGVDQNIGPFNIADGVFNVTIVDNDNPNCNTMVSIEPPAACSDCTIEPIEITSTHEVCFGAEDGTVQILNFDAGNSYTINTVPFTTANLDNLEAGIYTIEAVQALNCSESITFTIEEGFLMELVDFNVECMDNGTNTDPNDDFYEVTFTITNNNGNTGTYDVVDQNASLIGNYNYGITQTVILPADGSLTTFTFADTDLACDLIQDIGTLDPCSSTCALSVDQLDFVCNDNGTPTDSADDFYDVTILVTAINGSGTYNVLVNGTDMYSFDYGLAEMFTLDADGMTIYSIAISDATDAACLANETIGPLASCSDECLLDPMVNNVLCDPNGTEDNDADDTFTFDLNVTGMNVGGSYSVPELSLTNVSYGDIQNLGPFDIASGSFDITIVDSDNPDCNTTVTINPPSPCSNCNVPPIEISTTNEICFEDANGTLEIINFDPNLVYELNNVVITSSMIDDLEDGMYTLVATDMDDCSEMVTFMIDPGLELTLVEFELECMDMGTDSDPLDDQYTVSFTVNNNNGNAGSYSVTDQNAVNLGSFAYGVSNAVVLPAGIDPWTFNFTDDLLSCSISTDFGPLSPCSGTCVLTVDELLFDCNDNGTPSDASDDFYDVSITASAVNGTGSYTLAVDNVDLDQVSYGSTYMFTLPADGSNVVLTLTDVNDIDCTIDMPIGPLDSCSDLCSISATVTPVICDDNGTGNDDTDDTFSFDLSVTGLNIGGGYTITEYPTVGGNYNQSYNLGPFLITDGAIVLTIVDDTDPNCFTTLTVDPPAMPCSDCPQTMSLDVSNVLSCDMPTATITLTTSEPGSYDWLGPSFTSMDQNVIVSNPGIYEVTVTYDDGCVLIDQIQVTAENDIPIAVVGPDQLLNCVNNTAQLDASLSTFPTGVNFEWTDESGTVISTELSTTTMQSGTYYFQILDPATGCNSAIEEVVVNENFNGPDASIQSNAGTSIDCSTDMIALSNVQEPNVVYTWTINGQMVNSLPLVITDAAEVVLTAVDTISFCENSMTMTIENRIEFPEIVVEEYGPIGCEGGEVCLSASNSIASAGVEFNWYNELGDFIENTQRLCVTEEGTYMLELFNPSNGCLVSESFFVQGASVPEIIAADTITFLIEDELDISIDVNLPLDEIEEIIWSPADILACNNCLENTIINPQNNMLITVEVVSITGCRTSESILITNEIDHEIWTPNIINPDSNSGNHAFTLYGTEEVEKIVEMLIYDRWGELVFIANDIDPNQIDLGWNGKFNGQDAAEGVYAFFIRYSLINGTEDQITGDLTVIR